MDYGENPYKMKAQEIEIEKIVIKHKIAQLQKDKQLLQDVFLILVSLAIMVAGVLHEQGLV